MTRAVVVVTVFLLGLLAALPAVAIGLGAIEVTSALNEPFRARIALSGLRAGEVEELRAALAGEGAFERAGLERAYLLTRLRFEPRASGARGGYLLVTSRDVIREPAFSFIVEVSSAGQVVQRRYDVMLNLR